MCNNNNNTNTVTVVTTEYVVVTAVVKLPITGFMLKLEALVWNLKENVKKSYMLPWSSNWILCVYVESFPSWQKSPKLCSGIRWKEEAVDRHIPPEVREQFSEIVATFTVDYSNCRLPLVLITLIVGYLTDFNMKLYLLAVYKFDFFNLQVVFLTMSAWIKIKRGDIHLDVGVLWWLDDPPANDVGVVVGWMTGRGDRPLGGVGWKFPSARF